MRVVVGVIAATCATPLAVAAIFSALYGLQLSWFEGKHWETVVSNIALYAAFSAPIAFFVTIAAGAPIAHRLAHSGHTGLFRYALLGMILGAAPFALFDGYIIATKLLLDVRPVPDMDTVMVAARWAGLGAWCGLWSAVAYWSIAIRRPQA